LSNQGILRAELQRLFRWLKDKGVSAVITAERGEGTMTRFGLEEYVADCVILLDHRVNEQMSTRRLRIVKYRGTLHGTNEYPFLITKNGISVLPITSLGLDHPASTGRVSSGVKELDDMMGGKGYFRGSSILLSGTAGTGKSSLQPPLWMQPAVAENTACILPLRNLPIRSCEICSPLALTWRPM
jgi:circadian clock protein KaiC